MRSGCYLDGAERVVPAYGPTANQICEQLKTLLTPVIGTAETFKTVIFDDSPLAFRPEEPEDTTVLQSPLDTATLSGGEQIKRVNCVIITDDGFTQEASFKDATRMETRPKGQVTVTRRFLITTIYQFGKVALNDPNTTTSGKVHSAINEAVRTTLNNNPKLGFAVIGAGGIAGPGAHVSHEGLQNPEPFWDSFGGVVCHVSVMPLTVKVIEALG